MLIDFKCTYYFTVYYFRFLVGLIASLCFWTHFLSCKYVAIVDPLGLFEGGMFPRNRTLSTAHSNSIKNDLNIEITTTIEHVITHRNLYVQKCSKKKLNVSFLKVHKAGSTTVMNIFLRFAIQHKLNIVLPRNSKGNGFNYLGYGKTVDRERIVPLPINESYNILCNHVVYNRSAFRSIMPDDTSYVGILREPASHFKSAALYYGFYKYLRNISRNIPQDEIVSVYLKDPSKRKISTYFVHNRMSFDFGIPKEKFDNETFVDSYINELSEDYSVMLILEKFQDSLVLLKRELCWSTKDILYVPLNTWKSNLTFELDNDDITLLKQWNKADFKLYDHFLEEFKEKVRLHGDDFLEEVQHFKTVQGEVETFCKENASHNYTTAMLNVSKSKWDDGFIVTNRDCYLMMEHEIHMMKRLIESAWSRYNASMTHT
jgi:hypothetical protein